MALGEGGRTGGPRTQRQDKIIADYLQDQGYEIVDRRTKDNKPTLQVEARDPNLQRNTGARGGPVPGTMFADIGVSFTYPKTGKKEFFLIETVSTTESGKAPTLNEITKMKALREQSIHIDDGNGVKWTVIAIPKVK